MPNALRVLFVTESADQADRATLELWRSGYDVSSARVATEEEMRAALGRQSWDIALSDESLVRFGVGLLEESGLEIPFVVPGGAPGDLSGLLPAVERGLREAGARATRRRADQAADRLAALLAMSGDAIVGATVRGVITDWNPGAERLFGWSGRDAVGRTLSFLVPPDRAGESDRLLERVRRGDTVEAFETVWVHKDGTWLDVASSWSPIRSAVAVVGASVIARDIGRRKRAASVLPRSEELFRDLADAMPLIVWTARPDGHVDYSNRRWYEFTGRRRGEGGDESWVPVLHPDDVRPSLSAWYHSVRTGDPFEIEYRFTDPRTSTYRWYLGRALPLRDAGGKITRWFGTCTDIHDRKTAEADLRDSEGRYRTLLDRIPMPLFVYDRETLGYLAVNDAAVAKYGYLRDEFLRMKVTDIRPAEDIPALMALLDRSAPQFEDRGVWRHRKKDGTVIEVEITAHAMDLGGRPATVALAHDVTERRRAEAERDRLLAQLRLQIERMPLAYLLTGADLRYTRWNQAAERMFGFVEAEVLGKHPFEILVPPQSQEFVGSLFDRLRAGDMNAHRVSRNLTRDGRLITCEWYNTPLMDENGTFTGLLSLAQDVTVRLEADETLRLRDRAIQAVTQGIVIADADRPDDPIVYVSPSFERITGYARDEVLGKNCRFLQGKDTDREAVAVVRKAVSEARPCMVELLNYRKDGSTFWNELSLSPVRDPEGRLAHFIGVLTDVTERRLLEAQYRQAQKMDAIGQLAGGIAHDFNNLLTIITGYSDLLLQQMRHGDPNLELVEEIHRAGERSASLTRQLLVFSRKQVVAPKVVDLQAVVIDAEKMLRRLIGEDIRLETRLGTRLLLVRADPGQLDQVLMNLAVNARDAMPRGGRLTIATGVVELDGDYTRVRVGVRPGPHALLSVSDTGGGMTPEVMGRIWEPFYTTKGVGNGSGLGLSVVHGIVEQAGGFIEVESAPGVGTTFEIYLPSVEGSTEFQQGSADARCPPRGNETILVVEDEDGVRTLTRHVLVERGYAVLEASDGDEALSVADRHQGPIHLLMTDVVMPGPGGRELADRILATRPGTKVLYVSGYTDDAIVRHGVLEEQVSFLQKPFSTLALACKVREVLDG